MPPPTPSSTNRYNADRIAEIAEALFELDDKDMRRPRIKDGWSRKQILGHLIDSASVNHQRIIEAQITGSIVFAGYKHKQWVELQNYQAADWEELVALWCSLNMHLCEIITNIPQDVFSALHDTHSYDTTAYRELPADKPATLAYLIEDYFAHLEYHLHQIEDI